ncbi:MAG TPA: cupin domain-containing protein [Candidatus Angelobacter sp.]|nr:cupin domain-containing protein [Candidatus Angelobacter sp.]
MKRAAILAFGLLLAAQALAQDTPDKVTFVPAKQVDLAARRSAARLRAGVWYATFNNNKGYTTGVVRRTSATLAEEHASWTDVWYVIRGEGTLVTGGSLIDPSTESPGELRGRAIAGGVERHIAPGDVITVPAGVPHWVRRISGKEIVYLMVKIAAPTPTQR